MNQDRSVALRNGVLVGASTAVVGLSFIEQPAQADAVTDIAASAGTLSTISTAITPVAIGALVFGCAAILIKRFMYS